MPFSQSWKEQAEKVSNEAQDLNNTTEELDLIGSDRPLYRTTAKRPFYGNPQYVSKD